MQYENDDQYTKHIINNTTSHIGYTPYGYFSFSSPSANKLSVFNNFLNGVSGSSLTMNTYYVMPQSGDTIAS